MNRRLIGCVAGIVAVALLAGCGGGDSTPPPPTLDFSQMGGNWTGTWHNTTYDITGEANLAATVNPADRTVEATVTLTGDVFGLPAAPAPITLHGTYTDSVMTFPPTAAPIGTVSATLSSNGALTATITDIPGGLVSHVDITGTATATTVNANYTVHSVLGPTAVGTLVFSQ